MLGFFFATRSKPMAHAARSRHDEIETRRHAPSLRTHRFAPLRGDASFDWTFPPGLNAAEARPVPTANASHYDTSLAWERGVLMTVVRFGGSVVPMHRIGAHLSR
jgi:hypothetical protein